MSDKPIRRGILDGEESVPVEDQVEEVNEDLPKEDEEPQDPNEPLFDGGPTFAEIEDWKRVFGDVYVTSFGPDRHYVWRTLHRREYRDQIKRVEMTVASGQISQAEANLNNEEQITQLCLLFPRLSAAEITSDMAGVASIIAQEVMEASGFVAMDVRQL